MQREDQQCHDKIETRVTLMMSSTEVDFGQELSDTLDSAETKLGTIRCMLENPSGLADKYIDHIWFDNHTDVTHHGKDYSMQRSKNKPLTVNVAYRSTEEREEDAEDIHVRAIQSGFSLVFK